MFSRVDPAPAGGFRDARREKGLGEPLTTRENNRIVVVRCPRCGGCGADL